MQTPTGFKNKKINIASLSPEMNLGALMEIFYVALDSSMDLVLLVWGGRWSVKASFIFFLVISVV